MRSASARNSDLSGLQTILRAASGEVTLTFVRSMRGDQVSVLTACLLTVGALVSPLGVGVAVADPRARFEWAPDPVVAGAPVTFTSKSEFDEGAPVALITWDIGGGTCLEPASAICSTTAPAAPGEWWVTLTVVDTEGGSDSKSKRIDVEAPPPPPPPPRNEPPTAAFAGFPSSPSVGEEVTFVSYSNDPDGRITAQAWDLDGDGAFDDASGAVVSRTFSVPGPNTVSLRVTDDKGAASTTSLTLQLREQSTGSPAPGSPPATSGPVPLPRLLSPFPIVRLVGSVRRARTDIELLTVRAPKGSRALVRCRGKGCPISRIERVVRRTPTRVKAAERVMPAGAVLEVLVSRGDRIGKFTRFKFRRNRRPVRADGCLWPRTTRMAPCPGG
jgi:PKD repeat protein